jgi:glycosyltransferase AglD
MSRVSRVIRAARRRSSLFITVASAMILVLFLWMSISLFNAEGIGQAFAALLDEPRTVLWMTAGYSAAFVLRAAAWRIYVRHHRAELRAWFMYINPLLVSLLINHVLPVKAGDAARTGMLMRSAGMKWDEALQSVGVMRALDMATLLGIGAVGAAVVGVRVTEAAAWTLGWMVLAGLIAAAVTLIAAVRRRWGRVLEHAARLRRTMLSGRGLAIAALVLASWMLEGVVLLGVAREAVQAGDGDYSLGLLQAIWANSMTIAGQVFHVTPGGIGTYETTMTAALALLGMDADQAYAAAVVSHAYKFVYAYLFGGLACLMGAVDLRDLKSWIRAKRNRQAEVRPESKGESS